MAYNPSLPWQSALQSLATPLDDATRQQVVAFLHDAVNKGHVVPQSFLSQSQQVYRQVADVRLSTEIKRMQNRIRCRRISGQDLLRLPMPPSSDQERRRLWKTLQQLKIAYDGLRGEPDSLEARYELGEEIGQGAMGRILRAVRRSDGQPVAIKILHPRCMDHPTIPARFERESRLCLAFNHPHVIKVFESGLFGNQAFMIMEYLPLGSLEKFLGGPPLELVTAIAVLRQTVQALTYIHGQGVVHRDVKPANILIERWASLSDNTLNTLDSPVEIKLADFGISKELRVDGLTRTGARMGTPFYVAPEQLEAPEQVDHRADLYALGVTMYRLFSGRGYPYGQYPALNEIHPALPAAVDELLGLCLQPDPDRRPADAQVIDDVLAEVERRVRGD